MRLSTRFGIGIALAVLPLLGVITYSVEQAHLLALSNERITARQLVMARMNTGVIDRLERIAEYLSKYSVSEDVGYVEKVEQIVAATQAELETIAASQLSQAESEALQELMAAWTAFAQADRVALATGLSQTMADIDALISLANEVSQQAKKTSELEAAAATQTREATRHTALAVATSAIAVSLALILIAVRSLRRRLDEFITATMAVSRGALSYRLDTASTDELGALAQSFNRMVQALEQLERMKADFVSSVSHELKTPLVAMLETNQFLLDEVPGPLNESQQRMLKLNTQAAHRLSNMISDLLELSALKAGIRYKMAEHDLTELTHGAVAELEALALDRGIELRKRLPEGPLRATCDGDRFVQVVQNLIENALKYTPAGGRVEVGLRTCPIYSLPPESAASTAARHSSFALLTVDDSGPGIPECDRQRVFEKFFRRQGHSSDGGVGLGLAICREIVETHHGAIWVADSPLQGTSMHAAFALEDASRRSRTVRTR